VPVDIDVATTVNKPPSAKRRRTTVFEQTLETVTEPIAQQTASLVLQNEVQNRSLALEDHGRKSVATDEADDAKENQTPDAVKPPTKKRKRKSIGQQSMRKKKRPSTETDQATRPRIRSPSTTPNSMPDDTVEADKAQDARSTQATRSKPRRKTTSDDVEGGAMVSQSAEKDAIPAPLGKKRKKRKSITMQRKKRKSSDIIPSRSSLPADLSSDQSEASGDEENQDLTNKATAAMKSRPRPGRRPKAVPARPARESSPSHAGSASEDEYQESEHTPEAPTPAPPRTKTTRRSRRSSSSNNSSTTNKITKPRTRASEKRTTFPITTYRLTNTSLLPTIPEANESEPESDTNGNHHNQNHPTAAPSSRHPLNAIDVLAQYSREIISAAMSRLTSTTTTNNTTINRATLRRQHTALQTLLATLDARLRDMSTAATHRADLESQLRRAKRQKAEMQARWTAVRKEREEVALLCDEVRRENWREEKVRELKWIVDEQVGEVVAALAVEREGEGSGVGAVRGDETQEAQREAEGLEALLEEVAGEVGGAGSAGGGVLERVRLLNARLERVAGVLEGRGEL
jgi:hypothetical protein